MTKIFPYRFLVLVTPLLFIVLQIFADKKWQPIGLEDDEITSILTDYPYTQNANLFAGTKNGLNFYNGKFDKNWIKYSNISLPVNSIKMSLKGDIIVAIGNGSRSDAVLRGINVLDGPPFYVFQRINWLPWPQSLAISENKIYIGSRNSIFMCEYINDTISQIFTQINTPENCFGVKKPKCAAIEKFNSVITLYAGGYDEDTENPGQANLLGKRGNTLQTLLPLNVTCISLDTDTGKANSIYFGTKNALIYYYSIMMSSINPAPLCQSPYNESVKDIKIRKGDGGHDTIFVAVKSGIYSRCPKVESLWVEIGDLPSEPSCLVLMHEKSQLNSYKLYAGTKKGVYKYDSVSTQINYQQGNIPVNPIVMFYRLKETMFLRLNMHKSCKVKIDIFNVKGRALCTLFDSFLHKGKFNIPIASRFLNNKNRKYKMYILKITLGKEVFCNKIVMN